MASINDSRKKINEIDEKMAKLFCERMAAVKDIAEYKKENGLSIFDRAREEEIIKRCSSLIEGEELRSYYVTYLRNNMAISRSYQESILTGMKVAYSGTEGAFAHIATEKLFPTAKKIPYASFEDAYKSVEKGECDAVVLPLENSYNGEVGQVTDLMFSGSLYVKQIIELPITQDLIGVKGARLSDIKEVYSHPQALGQCDNFIKQNGFNTHEYANTALAAKMVAEKADKSVAAIASGDAARIFGLEIIAQNVNESRINTTRFAVFSRSESKPTSKKMGTETIILFTVRNEAGALAKAIEIIGKHGFNMRTLRSRPMKDLLWQYYFYVEAEGNVHTEEGKEMMHELSQYCDKLKSIGTFVKNNLEEK